MPREMRSQCFWCNMQMDHASRKYSTRGSMLFRVFVAANSGKRVRHDDWICGSCRRRYDRWRVAMQNDFDHLDVPINEAYLHDNEEPVVSICIRHYFKMCVFL
jgi:hypothetical protein